MPLKGKLKFFADLNSWFIVDEDDISHELLDSDVIDVDLNLSGNYYPCALSLKKETFSFVNIDLKLDKSFENNIIFYLQPRLDNDSFEIDLPF